MDILVFLLGLIAAVSGISLVLSYHLYRRDRENPVYKLQLVFWASVMSSFLVSAVTESGPDLVLAFVLIIFYISSLLQMKLMDKIYGLKIKDLPWGPILIGAIFVTVGLYLAGANFQMIALPLAMTAAIPSLYFVKYIKKIQDKNIFDNLLVFSLIFSGVHILDYPFLRKIPEAAPIGFCVYFMLLFIKSVTLPYLILSYTEKNHKRQIEAELERKTVELNDANSTINHRSKMSALGEMAGGIAHEINNPLATIKGRAELLKRAKLRGKLTDEMFLKEVDKIDNTVDRISKIIRSMRMVSGDHSGEVAKEQLTVWGVLEHPITLAEELCRTKSIQLKINVADQIKGQELICNPVQFSQVMLNLINNSADALMEEKNSDREKWIEISAITFDDGLEFRVTDAGEKIPKEVINKIFQPFYTTKAVGKGTGLGLSLCSKIVKANGGELKVDPARETTSFYFRLPLAEIAVPAQCGG